MLYDPSIVFLNNDISQGPFPQIVHALCECAHRSYLRRSCFCPASTKLNQMAANCRLMTQYWMAAELSSLFVNSSELSEQSSHLSWLCKVCLHSLTRSQCRDSSSLKLWYLGSRFRLDIQDGRYLWSSWTIHTRKGRAKCTGQLRQLDWGLVYLQPRMSKKHSATSFLWHSKTRMAAKIHLTICSGVAAESVFVSCIIPRWIYQLSCFSSTVNASLFCLRVHTLLILPFRNNEFVLIISLHMGIYTKSIRL